MEAPFAISIPEMDLITTAGAIISIVDHRRDKDEL
jgi:hypothetical protein